MKKSSKKTSAKSSCRQNARLYVRHSDDAHPQNNLEAFLRRHPFTARLQLLLPVRDLPPEIKNDAFSDNLFFSICRFELKTLISEAFLQKWIRDPDVTIDGISVNGWADLTDVLCISQRIMRLELTPESYRMMGLTGRVSSQRQDRYVVDVKLDGHHFHPGHRHYERVKACFERCKKTITMWISATRNGRPMPVPELQAVVERVHSSSTVLRPCSIPDLPTRTEDDDFWSSPHQMQALFEWIGGTTLNIDNRLEGIPLHPCRILHRLEVSGLLSPVHSIQAVHRCRRLLESYSVPWTAIVLTGFKDTPLSFSPSESITPSFFDQLTTHDHAVLDDTSGENDIVILLLPDRLWSVFVSLGSGDNFRTM